MSSAYSNRACSDPVVEDRWLSRLGRDPAQTHNSLPSVVEVSGLEPPASTLRTQRTLSGQSPADQGTCASWRRSHRYHRRHGVAFQGGSIGSTGSGGSTGSPRFHGVALGGLTVRRFLADVVDLDDPDGEFGSDGEDVTRLRARVELAAFVDAAVRDVVRLVDRHGAEVDVGVDRHRRASGTLTTMAPAAWRISSSWPSATPAGRSVRSTVVRPKAWWISSGSVASDWGATSTSPVPSKALAEVVPKVPMMHAPRTTHTRLIQGARRNTPPMIKAARPTATMAHP